MPTIQRPVSGPAATRVLVYWAVVNLAFFTFVWLSDRFPPLVLVVIVVVMTGLGAAVGIGLRHTGSEAEP